MVPLIFSRHSLGVKKVRDRRPAQSNRLPQNVLQHSIQLLHLVSFQTRSQLRRVNLRFPQAFVGINITDTAKYVLVQQQRLDPRPASSDSARKLLQSYLQRIRTKSMQLAAQYHSGKIRDASEAPGVHVPQLAPGIKLQKHVGVPALWFVHCLRQQHPRHAQVHEQRAFLIARPGFFLRAQPQQQKFPVALHCNDFSPRQLLLHRRRIVDEIRLPQRDAQDLPSRNRALQPTRYSLDFRQFRHILRARSTYHIPSSATFTRATVFRLEVSVRCRFFLCLSLLAVSLAVPPRSAARTKETGFLDRALSLHGATYKYQVFVPEDWSAKQKWPIILFLHGGGERGSDGLLQTDVGLPHAIRQDRSRFPIIVVIPQCLKDHLWTEPQMEEIALASLAAATKEFKGDAKRTYLTGLSMGGSGSWDLAARYPDKFAAIVPICGRIPTEDKARAPDDNSPYVEVAKKIGKTPVWIFHGGDDPVVPVSDSRHMAEAMKTVLGQATVYTEPHRPPVKVPAVIYTEYPGAGHNSWDKAYSEPNLIPWLLSWSLLKKGETPL